MKAISVITILMLAIHLVYCHELQRSKKDTMTCKTNEILNCSSNSNLNQFLDVSQILKNITCDGMDTQISTETVSGTIEMLYISLYSTITD